MVTTRPGRGGSGGQGLDRLALAFDDERGVANAGLVLASTLADRLGIEHPILATRAETGEVLHARMRKGSASTQRGAERFVCELVRRVRRLGASGRLTVRADSGFWSYKTIETLERHSKTPAQRPDKPSDHQSPRHSEKAVD